MSLRATLYGFHDFWYDSTQNWHFQYLYLILVVLYCLKMSISPDIQQMLNLYVRLDRENIDNFSVSLFFFRIVKILILCQAPSSLIVKTLMLCEFIFLFWASKHRYCFSFFCLLDRQYIDTMSVPRLVPIVKTLILCRFIFWFGASKHWYFVNLSWIGCGVIRWLSE